MFTYSAIEAGSWHRGKPYFNDRSGSFRSRYGDRAAKLTHKHGHVVGSMILRSLRRILVLHTHAVIGDGELNLVADLFGAYHHEACSVAKSVLDCVRHQLIDQKTERYGTIGVDFQRFRLDLYSDARCASKQAR